MFTLPKLLIAGIIATCLSMLSLSGCADMNGPSPWVTKDQCNGQPDWCVRVSNESDDDMEIYLNGSHYATLSGGDTEYLPVTAGQSYEINACYEITRGWLEIPVRKVCLSPDRFTANGIYNEVFYPSQ
ncbi:MAG: hypothetical protein KGJ18_06395 [Gammaproteobacteria bacterium]|nr:hypothetical protein [Gammaproteobacteria bacterium]